MTALGNILAGARLTASMLQGVAPLAVIKGADQSVTNSATLVNDNALFLPVAANASYLLECFLAYEGGTGGVADLKYAFTGPAGFTMQYQLGAISTGASWTGGFLRNAAGQAIGTSGAGNRWGATMFGTVTIGAAAGTLQLQFAQNTANATATIMHAGSSLALWQVS